MRVLVTGADGFIGGYVVSELSRVGHEVIGTTFMRKARASELEIDLTRPSALSALPDVEVVVHTAGVVDVREPYEVMHAVNVEGTRNITAWARRARVRHFVHLSSVSVYGPLTMGEERSERTPRLGTRLGVPYMRTKAAAEPIVESSGIPFSMLRPPAVIGPGDNIVSASIVEALRRGEVPLVEGGRTDRKVNVVSADGLATMVQKLIAHGPLQGAVHAMGPQMSLGEVLARYARAGNFPIRFKRFTWPEVLSRRADSGFLWLVVSARFGQSYDTRLAQRLFGDRPDPMLESAIQEAVSSLQGKGARIS